MQLICRMQSLVILYSYTVYVSSVVYIDFGARLTLMQVQSHACILWKATFQGLHSGDCCIHHLGCFERGDKDKTGGQFYVTDKSN